MAKGYTVVHRPHECSKPPVHTMPYGTVIQCTCGQRWCVVSVLFAKAWRKSDE